MTTKGLTGTHTKLKMKSSKELSVKYDLLYVCLALVLVLPAYAHSKEDKCLSGHMEECVTGDQQRGEHRLESTLTFRAAECQLRTIITIDSNNSVAILGTPTEVICCGPANTGIRVREATNFILKDLILSRCGLEHELTILNGTLYYLKAAVLLINCTNVTVQALSIQNSNGTGMVMLDNDGEVRINASKFENNALTEAKENAILSGGSGLYIETQYCGVRPKDKNYVNFCHDHHARNISDAEYFISNSLFSGNNNSNLNSKMNYSKFYTGLGAGGGGAIVASGTSQRCKFVIDNSWFKNNTSSLGGGLYIAVQDGANDIEVTFYNTIFESNMCTASTGLGGGISAGFLINPNEKVQNSIKFISCNFFKNKARYGGGSSFFFSKSVLASNSFNLSASNWTQNEAIFGAAIKISPHLYGTDSADTSIQFVLTNVRILSNIFYSDPSKGRGRATLLVETCKSTFSGKNIFESNQGSALCLDSAEAEFTNFSSTTFINNVGFQGGAIAMTGYSILKFNDHTRFLFVNNSAQDGGGAIFQMGISSRDVQVSRTCFIQYVGKKENILDSNSSFVFLNNSATVNGRTASQLSRYGHSILTSSIDPCQRSRTNCRQLNRNEILTCIGNFNFSNRNIYDVSSYEDNVTIPDKVIYVIPGKLTSLNLRTFDDFSHEVAAVYHVTINSNDSDSPVTSDEKYTYVSDSIQLYGKPNQTATLDLESTTIRRVSIQIQVIIQECPPGFTNREIKEGRWECKCFPENMSSFSGIRFCSRANYVAYLLHGYWIGYDNTNKMFAQEREIIFSSCYYGRCLSHNEAYTELQNTTNTTELNTRVCGRHRTGVFCSRCQSGYFMNYHSRKFICRPSPNKCRLGWLYYILSELAPVTIFFVIVTLFDVRLTSGSVNGLILFFQLSDSLQTQGNGFIRFPQVTERAFQLYFLLTGIFNMDFFEADEMSYCLWETANTLDLLAIKYLTMAYALGLVVVLILVLKYCNMIKFFASVRKKFLQKSTASTFSSTAIHGIAGFMVICYSETTKVSLLLLTPAKLYYFGKNSAVHVHSLVSSSDGNFIFFQGKHLLYAIPALAVLTVLGLAPPMFLFAYPLCYKLFAILRISESRFVQVMCTLLPLEKCRPFFDSFQSGFKDDCRFFAGLHFLYRLIILVTLALAGHSITFHIILALEFLLAVILHAIFQPLKNPSHNRVDALLFANLLAINILTIFNYFVTFYYVEGRRFIQVTGTIQVLLLYLPLVCALVSIAKKASKMRFKKENTNAMNYWRLSAMLDAIEERSSE